MPFAVREPVTSTHSFDCWWTSEPFDPHANRWLAPPVQFHEMSLVPGAVPQSRASRQRVPSKVRSSPAEVSVQPCPATPLQSQIWMAAPGVELLPLTSRQRPDDAETRGGAAAWAAGANAVMVTPATRVATAASAANRLGRPVRLRARIMVVPP